MYAPARTKYPHGDDTAQLSDRLFGGDCCPKGSGMYTLSSNKSVIPALRYGCYRESRMATLPVSAMIALHNAINTWRNNVDAFITLTDFQRETIARFGIPSNSLFVKPHFLEHPPQPIPWKDRDNKAVFVGRLYVAKGIHVLLEAWNRMGRGAPHLEVVGDGPMRSQLVHSAQESEASDSISFLGNVSREEAMNRMSRAKLLIGPIALPRGISDGCPRSFCPWRSGCCIEHWLSSFSYC